MSYLHEYYSKRGKTSDYTVEPPGIMRTWCDNKKSAVLYYAPLSAIAKNVYLEKLLPTVKHNSPYNAADRIILTQL